MKKLLFIPLCILILSACNSVSYVHQTEENAFIQFSGNYQNIEVKVDDLTFQVTESTSRFELNDQDVVKFEIPLGKHQLTVIKDQQTIIKKFIFISNGQTLEVNIP